MKDDEKRFLLDVYRTYFESVLRVITPREIINRADFYIPYKRAWYLLQKWADKDWYDYGVTLDMGWLTERGMEEAGKLWEEVSG